MSYSLSTTPRYKNLKKSLCIFAINKNGYPCIILSQILTTTCRGELKPHKLNLPFKHSCTICGKGRSPVGLKVVLKLHMGLRSLRRVVARIWDAIIRKYQKIQPMGEKYLKFTYLFIYLICGHTLSGRHLFYYLRPLLANPENAKASLFGIKAWRIFH